MKLKQIIPTIQQNINELFTKFIVNLDANKHSDANYSKGDCTNKSRLIHVEDLLNLELNEFKLKIMEEVKNCLEVELEIDKNTGREEPLSLKLKEMGEDALDECILLYKIKLVLMQKINKYYIYIYILYIYIYI